MSTVGLCNYKALEARYTKALLGRKGKEEYLYSAFLSMWYTQSAQAWITQFYLQITPCLPFLRERSPVFLVANIRGGLTTKLDELQLLFISNDVDICVISETWLHDSINSDILQIADYSLFRLDRRGGQQGGGLAVYVKQGISCSFLSQFTHNELEVLWLLYRPHSMPREVTNLLIGAVYHPPKANNFQMLDYLVASMDEFTRAHPYTGILMLGDFNQLPDSQQKSFLLVTDWYQTPIILPGVSRSDHEAIHLKPAADPPRPSRSIRLFCRRLVSPNRKALLCDELKHVNWTPFYNEFLPIHGQLFLLSYDRLSGSLHACC